MNAPRITALAALPGMPSDNSGTNVPGNAALLLASAPIMPSTEPVSYTHLDVYKRQVFRRVLSAQSPYLSEHTPRWSLE